MRLSLRLVHLRARSTAQQKDDLTFNRIHLKNRIEKFAMIRRKRKKNINLKHQKTEDKVYGTATYPKPSVLLSLVLCSESCFVLEW